MKCAHIKIYHTSSIDAKLKNGVQVLRAGMPGFEPRVTESESVVLPVTPHPNILLSAPSGKGCTEKFSTCCLLDASVVFTIVSLNAKAVPI